MKKKYATFSVNCTYTIPIEVAEHATEEETEKAAWDALNRTIVDVSDLDSDDWELLQIDG